MQSFNLRELIIQGSWAYVNSRAKGAPSSRISARCLTGGGLFIRTEPVAMCVEGYRSANSDPKTADDDHRC